MSWRDALLHFFDQKATGVVAIEAFREIRWCYLIEGQPVHYLGDKPHPGEFLSDALVADGVIELAVWAEALRMQRVTGIPAGEFLVRTGGLSRAALQGALSRRAARITRNLMGMNFGTFRFHPFPRLGDVFDHEPVDVLAVLLGSQRESLAAIEDERLTQQVENLYPLHAKPVEARRGLLAQLPLTEDERRVALELLPACWTLGELVALKEMDERRLVRLLLALKALGMVQFTREEGSDSKRNRAERILYVGLKDLTRRNDFEALHAHWSSSSSEIEQGYLKILEEYGRERFQQVLDERLEGLMDEIRQRADSIWQRLKDAQGRRAARKEVVGDDQLRMASDLLDRQGEMAAFKNDFLLVRACSQRVLELDPGGSEGVENIRRAKTWLADPRIQGLATSGSSAAKLEEIQRKLDGLL